MGLPGETLALGRKGLSYTGKFAKFNLNAAAWAMKAPFKLVGLDKLAKMGWDSADKVVDGAEWSARVAKEGAMGVGVNALGASVGELAIAPGRYVYRLFVGNTRTVLEDVFTLKTPKNIIKAPWHFGQGIKRGTKEALASYKDVIKNAVSFKPLSAINSTRKAITSTFAIPFKGVWDSTSPILSTPYQMGKNIVNAHMAYPQAVWKMPQHWRKGIDRVKNAPATASKEMAEEEKRIHMMNVLKDKRNKYGESLKKGKTWAGEKWSGVTGDSLKPQPRPEPEADAAAAAA